MEVSWPNVCIHVNKNCTVKKRTIIIEEDGYVSDFLLSVEDDEKMSD